MPIRLVFSISVFLLLAGLAFGGSPVATVTSSGTFDLHGSTVRTEGIPYWPVMTGDEIVTHGSAALVRFQDGTSVSLGANSSAKIENSGGTIVFRLVGGTMQVTALQTPAVRFYSGIQQVAVHSGVNQSVGSGTRPQQDLSGPPPPSPVSGK